MYVLIRSPYTPYSIYLRGAIFITIVCSLNLSSLATQEVEEVPASLSDCSDPEDKPGLLRMFWGVQMSYSLISLKGAIQGIVWGDYYRGNEGEYSEEFRLWFR